MESILTAETLREHKGRTIRYEVTRLSPNGKDGSIQWKLEMFADVHAGHEARKMPDEANQVKEFVARIFSKAGFRLKISDSDTAD